MISLPAKDTCMALYFSGFHFLYFFVFFLFILFLFFSACEIVGISKITQFCLFLDKNYKFHFHEYYLERSIFEIYFLKLSQ